MVLWRMRLAGAMALLVLPLAACEGPRVAPLYRDHPLVNRIWKPSEQRFATAGEVFFAVQSADFVILGEKHDNPDHHRIQGQLVARSGGKHNRPVAVVMEMLSEDQQPALDQHRAARSGDARGVGAAVGWDATGWPAWRIYEPIAEAAMGRNAPLLYGSLERDRVKAVAREGPVALGESRMRALKLDAPPGQGVLADMRSEIQESHCGQLPEPLLDPMANVTLAKDAVMAERLIAAREGNDKIGAILIAGNGHARADWGVPWHLRRLAPDDDAVSIGLLEVEGGETNPAAYADAHYDGAFPYDFVWFTARLDDDDPCAIYAEQLRRLRDRNAPESPPETD